MIDLILIQDRASGLGLFKYKGSAVYIDPNHEELFQGFLSAFQGIMQELKLGNLIQISTEEHHFIINYELPMENKHAINVIMMFDCEDCVDTLRKKAKEIECEFRNMFGNGTLEIDTSRYDMFRGRLELVLEMDQNSCVEVA
ncbi:MAG: hypothetical protein EU530_07845 [Promethearchaeota archaeon]|nr:MAG: hypothetical protein EU530_07845 [Candidatus Lokiarchaeota archaeon]